MIAKGQPRAAIWIVLIATGALGARGADPAFAEPTFLSKQYPRCTACHYSASGGGLLTPYGRSLSREEISTFGRQGDGAEPAPGTTGEEGFLFGALSSESPFQLGLDIRPSQLRVGTPGREVEQAQFPDDARSAGGLAAGPVEGLRHRRTPAPWPRRPAGVLRALDRGSGQGGGERARRTLPARLRCPLRRSHVVHPRWAATGAGRPDLRCRGGRVDRSRAVAGIRRSGTRRVADRGRGARRVHLDRGDSSST